ncbi:hypothetical protein G1H11_21795 [Phytoactinopolyspora alkaliphila]|uniref:Uncharacterized protein n=1 Tax=Phytoactinopolyspora alkaliphila TaxID=1783498 RepID=A0A6N9YSB7_9ACTN|nr:hypothetical protein [Phytoactinopolyspora alkaliphila]NED97936.1 hypothetical protein [Phytoactinopolyspora alkaliphila]
MVLMVDGESSAAVHLEWEMAQWLGVLLVDAHRRYASGHGHCVRRVGREW